MPFRSRGYAARSAFAVALVSFAACRDIAQPAPPNLHVTAPVVLPPGLDTIYGPERFTRRTGEPETETRTIVTPGFEAPFILSVRSGGAEGSHRVSSGTVWVDGRVMLAPHDFSPHQSDWLLPVTPGAELSLAVQLAGAPGSFLEVTLLGQRSGTLFCPTGGPGAYTDLQAAINATDPGGTVLVCNGEWDVPEPHVNRPLTIRSQHPGGATLGDTTSIASQGSRPIIWVDSAPGGLVRFADIGFAMRGRGIVTGRGTDTMIAAYQRIEIDSAWFVGRNTTLAFGVVTYGSTVPGAVVEFTNSRCTHVNICVFAVRPAPTNVRRSRFDSSAVVYTTLITAAAVYGQGDTEDNEFTHCPRPTGCITIFSDRGVVTVRRNRITQQGSVTGMAGAITILRNGSLSPLGLVTIEDNEIISHATGGAPTAPAGWELPAGIFVQEFAGVGVAHVIHRNRIADAYAGFNFSIGNSSASDNTIMGGVLAFTQANNPASIVTFRRNDAVGTSGSFAAPATGANDYTCNYWGSTAGPIAPPPTVPATTYTPFSTVPIANQPGVVCP